VIRKLQKRIDEYPLINKKLSYRTDFLTPLVPFLLLPFPVHKQFFKLHRITLLTMSDLPKTMKAIKVTAPGKPEIQDVPLPKLRDDYILVKVKAVALNPVRLQYL
jgi:hypothetical protein